MRHVRRLIARLYCFFRSESSERDLDREIASHLTLLADEFGRRGMTPQEARQAARRAFGGVDQAKELSRDERSVLWFEHAWQDLRHACRSLWHSPGFTLVAVITLALGIGVNATLFTAYNAVALKPLPVANPKQVVRLERWFQNRGVGDIQYAFSDPEYVYCRDHNDVFSGLVAASWPIRVLADIRNGGSQIVDTETLQGELVSANYFSDLGIVARIGRTFLPDKDREAAGATVVVLSDSFWQRRFNGDSHILGHVIVMNGVAFAIVGVAPEEFTGTSVGLLVPDFWAPLSMQSQLVPGQDWHNEPMVKQLQILARLKPSTTLKQAQAQTDILIRQFATTYPERDPTKVVTLQHTSFLGNTEDTRFQAVVAGLMLIVGMVLMLACANIANMLLARGVARQREIAVRLALGASRSRVIRHLLTESILLSLAGGMAGLLLSVWTSKLLLVVVERILEGPLTAGLVLKLNLSPDIRVFAYTLSVSVVTGVLFGLSPALQFTRPELTTALKDEATFFGQRLSRSRVRGALVAAQVTVSTVLLISAGLLLRGMIRSQAAGTGFETRRVFLLSADFGRNPAKAAAMERRLIDRLKTLPAVKNAGFGYAPLLGTWTPPIIVEGPRASLRGRTLASYASDTYLDTLGIALLRGRSFTRQEAEKGAPVAVISESTARRFWPEEDPLGKRFQLDMYFRGNLTEFEVVGIAKDVRFANLTRIDPAHVYLPTNMTEPYTMLVRVQGDTQAAVAAARAALGGLSGTLLPSLSLISLDEGPLRIHKTLAQTLAMLGAILASLALTLAAVGIYGVMAFLVGQRVREIGIRMALGATPGGVLNAIVLQGLRPVLVGIVFGIAGASGLSWTLHTSLAFPGSSDLLYGIPFYDPATFLGVSFLIMSVAVAASALPAQRALRVDPMVALRYQ